MGMCSILQRFYRYHELLNQKELQAKRKENLGQMPQIPYFTIFKKCLPQLFNVFFVFFVTLAIFPAVHSGWLLIYGSLEVVAKNCIFLVTDIKRSDENFFISEKYFTEITCFLTFNFCAMVGSTTSAWLPWVIYKLIIVKYISSNTSHIMFSPAPST
jgi:equilibrative nucleoside transporter 1/2/3